jgi:hypothetical protein
MVYNAVRVKAVDEYKEELKRVFGVIKDAFGIE